MTGADRTWAAAAAVAGLAALVALAMGVPDPAVAPPAPIDTTQAPPKEKPTARPVPTAPRPVPDGARVETLPNGVTVTELSPGEGEPLLPTRVGALEYTAWDADGEVAGSSFRRQAPTRLPMPAEVDLVGWQLGLVGLRPGGVRRIHQPATPADGPKAQPRPELTYEVELLSVLVPPSGPAPVPEGGWTRLPDGIEVHDLVEGAGPAVATGTTATFDYAVFLPDGTRLDDSWQKTAPVRLPIGSGKLAFESGLIGARVGGRRQLRVPPELSPSPKGRPSSIPEGTPLLVIVELRAVE